MGKVKKIREKKAMRFDSPSDKPQSQMFQEAYRNKSSRKYTQKKTKKIY